MFGQLSEADEDLLVRLYTTGWQQKNTPLRRHEISRLSETCKRQLCAMGFRTDGMANVLELGPDMHARMIVILRYDDKVAMRERFELN